MMPSGNMVSVVGTSFPISEMLHGHRVGIVSLSNGSRFRFGCSVFLSWQSNSFVTCVKTNSISLYIPNMRRALCRPFGLRQSIICACLYLALPARKQTYKFAVYTTCTSYTLVLKVK